MQEGRAGAAAAGRLEGSPQAGVCGSSGGRTGGGEDPAGTEDGISQEVNYHQLKRKIHSGDLVQLYCLSMSCSLLIHSLESSHQQLKGDNERAPKQEEVDR